MMNPKEKIIERFRAHKLRLTDTRERLIALFLQSAAPLSYEGVKTRLPMDKATFYRNMHAFESAGVIRKIASDGKRWYFGLATPLHAHFICTRCHRIECLEIAVPSLAEGYDVDAVTYRGVCPLCAD